MDVLQMCGSQPHDVLATLRFHGLHAVPGVEAWDGVTYRRTLRLPDGSTGRIALRAGGPGTVTVETDLADVDTVETLVRDLLDLDRDPAVVDAALAADPALAALVVARPGLRSPGAADGAELGVRTVVGQQVSLAGARTVLGRIAAAHGDPLPGDGPDRLFPTAATFAALDPAVLPLPRARGRALVGLAAAVADGRVTLRRGADADAETAALLALPGIGPWTANYLRMRVFRDPDILLASDLAVRRVAAELGLDLSGSERWAPWRSYVTHHLWAVVLDRL
ncbi:DNA-3-methyladenine glycosylase family protein [Jatrophihabitans sp. YIM 134969]